MLTKRGKERRNQREILFVQSIEQMRILKRNGQGENMLWEKRQKLERRSELEEKSLFLKERRLSEERTLSERWKNEPGGVLLKPTNTSKAWHNSSFPNRKGRDTRGRAFE